MKKWLAVLGSLVGVLLLTALVAGTAFAQGPVADGERVGRGRGFGLGFVDEDSVRAQGGATDNDRYGTNPEFVDEDGDGVCDVCGGLPGEGEPQEKSWGRGYGLGFVDEDGDGINDRYGTNPEFVDEDGDGLCDTHGVAPGEGTAQGYSRWFRAEGETSQTPMTRRGGYGRRAAAQ